MTAGGERLGAPAAHDGREPRRPMTAGSPAGHDGREPGGE